MSDNERVDPRKFLTRLADRRNENVPVVIGGETYYVRTVLRVGDVGDLGPDYDRLNPMGRACCLFAALGLTPDKQPLIGAGQDSAWFERVDAVAISRAMHESGAMAKIFPPREEREEDAGGKP